MPEPLGIEEINRLAELRISLNSDFYSRLNFFLVFESVLLGAAINAAYSKPNPNLPILVVVVLLGLSLTIIWGYVQARQKYQLDDVGDLLQEVAPEYKMVLERRERKSWPLHSMPLLAYIVPFLVAAVWIVLLFFLLL